MLQILLQIFRPTQGMFAWFQGFTLFGKPSSHVCYIGLFAWYPSIGDEGIWLAKWFSCSAPSQPFKRSWVPSRLEHTPLEGPPPQAGVKAATGFS